MIDIGKLNKKVDLDLGKIKADPFSAMAAFQEAARKEEWPAEEIGAVLMACRYLDYEGVVAILDRFTRDNA